MGRADHGGKIHTSCSCMWRDPAIYTAFEELSPIPLFFSASKRCGWIALEKRLVPDLQIHVGKQGWVSRAGGLPFLCLRKPTHFAD